MTIDPVLRVRNPRFAYDGVRIRCEVAHPALGWLPAVLDPCADSERVRALYADVAAGGAGEIAPFDAQDIEAACEALEEAVADHVALIEREKGSALPDTAVWRQRVWAHAAIEIDKVAHGRRPWPGVEAFLDELPALDAGVARA